MERPTPSAFILLDVQFRILLLHYCFIHKQCSCATATHCKGVALDEEQRLSRLGSWTGTRQISLARRACVGATVVEPKCRWERARTDDEVQQIRAQH